MAKEINFTGKISLEDTEAREWIQTLDNKFTRLNEKVKSLGRENRELRKLVEEMKK